ncbi:5-oxoprolinase/urea amidolyase family protein [Arthrobacter sp. MMS18-M83]|uniref:5-oxoprolinase subunit B/C family protein n=1 Tax=Arthrobacter sp. MMS18-M83 TaxID=2996261 RepID=UPI00227BA2A0|nr:5-oxoprolinase/urea amidolyase family protein [Arthrobacter sp. MMS18-M83]WAH98702.1 5-oxoprolinase/urea amidolyase family protein [Arthrobacter sp. MMS18-M83]
MSITGIRWAGPRALLVKLSDLAAVLAFHSRLLAEPLPGQLDAIAAAATVLLKFGTHAEALAARTAVGHVDLHEMPQHSPRQVTIEVVYDGEDLAEVGMLTGLGADGVVAAHTGQLWTAAFGGFAPGFAYLLGENHSLDVPRRSSPRTAVPAGSVALGGTFSAVYPRQSPGGWQLIGRTTAVLWDLERESPALVRPGDTVRYVAVREAVELTPPQRPAAEEVAGPALVVGSPGLQSLIQDLGRPGLGDLGVSAAGAVDQQSARQANRLVGNQPGAAVVETVLGGLSVKADGDQVLAIAGAVAPLEILDASGATVRRAAMCSPFALLDGETLGLGAPSLGARSYLAVRGGLDVQPVLGSRSSDSMSGIGPAPLSAGMRLPVGKAPLFQMVGAPEESTLRLGTAAAELRVTLGPRDDWFDSGSLKSLAGQDWITTEQSNRIGVRLAPGGGRALERNGVPERNCVPERGAGELPSEGAVAGSLQVPPSGHPVLFLADHPVTGGYPVIAVVVPEDIPTAAQLPPGHSVRFTIVDPATLEPLELAATGVVPEGTQP